MKLLALDTSSEGCSAALFVDGEVIEKFEIAPRGHTRLLMPMIRTLLAESGYKPEDLDALAFACGPGSFTGVRIATGVVQGLAWGLDLPVISVSSLETVALGAIETMQVSDGEGVAVAFDARMSELYWACFSNRSGLPELLGEERVCPPSGVALVSGIADWVGAGQGWVFRGSMPDDVSGRINSVDETLVPRAGWVARLAAVKFNQGLAVPAEQAQPVYVRDEVTWKKLPGRD
ncbi:tRNA (adenosine(37)-N6)-threonylcarbamoyltransferase complex dimerization subunit type 1 TsaB [Marinobacter sp. F3R11]|uniref:tRNA (adenosine(37)-N6)-threonylcarbamoyltransferase complex dimerization subunit type 1 TsaB n=1 Tax=Marinobacter sp. F3R11 TaxID=2267231 RepID=UPI000DE9990E|nr:tRNA (adenosine(37)-N6)-threonylcarbamoyltransferase complex dimerization subunit type 1 TsaB [Marinobacter sp. F3R11]RBW50620.1 tRNA (adenosine(37)-N6)-threonylcarbamoyltransferase complex dimerization subunit type 1 TsaB [Marinobacter sp. F3R11]